MVTVGHRFELGTIGFLAPCQAEEDREAEEITGWEKETTF